MHEAARGGHLETVRVLLDAGANVNAKDFVEVSPAKCPIAAHRSEHRGKSASAGNRGQGPRCEVLSASVCFCLRLTFISPRCRADPHAPRHGGRVSRRGDAHQEQRRRRREAGVHHLLERAAIMLPPASDIPHLNRRGSHIISTHYHTLHSTTSSTITQPLSVISLG